KLQKELQSLLGGAEMITWNPDSHIFGRPQFWQGEDEEDEPRKRKASPKVLLLQTVLEDASIHLWIDRKALKKGDLKKISETASGT
ncbi:MAG: hypothetical protein K0S65_4100, partial [Labilithrix sp.]|nr:hypothetical protein [Labilithrix sp.]